MVKIVTEKVTDPRPRINAMMESDDGRTTAEIARGYVNIQRGVKTAILRMPYEELDALADLVYAAKDMLNKNGYETAGGTAAPMADEAEGVSEHGQHVAVPDDASSLHQDNPFAARA